MWAYRHPVTADPCRAQVAVPGAFLAARLKLPTARPRTVYTHPHFNINNIIVATMPPRKRRSDEEEEAAPTTSAVDHTPRKRSRLQHVESADEQSEADDASETTPSKPQTAKKPGWKGWVLAPVEEEGEEDEAEPEALGLRRARSRTNGSVSRASVNEDEGDEAETPKRGRGGLKGGKSETPKRSAGGRTLFATPKKLAELKNDPPSRNAADRSARRKSTKTLIERTMNGEVSDDDEDEQVARHIYGDEEELDEPLEEALPLQDEAIPDTPSKKGRRGPKPKPKGKGKGKARARSPTPPLDLPPPELYFAQNKTAALKTSNHTLSSLALLDHDEYFTLLRSYKDPHQPSIDFLESLHARSFPQWDLELREGFNILCYGWGSKRHLLEMYAQHIYDLSPSTDRAKIVVVNGYNPSTTLRSILTTLSNLLPDLPKSKGTSGQPTEMADKLLFHLSSTPSKKLHLIIHSLDSPPLRRGATQNLIARLASHPQIHLVASSDHPNAALLWDSGARASLNFVWHDTTTFASYEVERPAVDEVHALLGRSGRRVGGKEGVGFVLRSLPVNARSLFKILVMEQLMGMEEGGEEAEGVEYRTLYQKAVEDFVCGDEVAFRSLLKEFHDHQMVVSRKDGMGTDMLSVPFRKEELEGILEDLMA